jgi:hypothetical protein
MKIVWDITQIKTVPIDSVTPNPWNPKELGLPEFERVKMSLEQTGLRLPIIVREVEGGYQILDGEQRWRASKALGSPEILILNQGVVSDKEAVEMTIYFEQHVPPTQLKLADLLVTHMDKYPNDFQLPYPVLDLDAFRKLHEFDWASASTKKEDVQSEMDDVQDYKIITLKMKLSDFAVIEEAHKKLKTKVNVPLEDAWKVLSDMYLLYGFEKPTEPPNGEQR